jgi:beta-barrel assembly-enhancing protease
MTYLRRLPGRLSLVLTLLALFMQLSCSGSGVNSGSAPASPGDTAPQFKPGFNLFSPQQDIEMGRQSAVQISKEMPILRDQQIVGYVQQLGAKLAAKAPGEKFPYSFNVIGTKDINAFALPGGFIFVNAGALAAARNEGELAGVMAHEVMHVALRHGTNQATKAYLAKAGLGVLGSIASSQRDGGIAGILASIGGAGANMLFLKFGRTAEKQADIEGARIMANAGYDPRDMASFFKLLEKMGGQGVPEFMSDHPDPGNRIASIEEVYKELPVRQNPVHDTPEFLAARARLTGEAIPASKDLRRVGPSDSTRIPSRARPEAPSSQSRSFQSPDGKLGLEHPANWDVLAAGELNYIIAPKGAYGQADGTLMVTHGIFVGLIKPLGPDLESSNSAFIRKQLEDNLDFKIARAPQSINFGGRPGFGTVTAGPSASTGVLEIDTTYTTITADGRFFYIITIVPQDEMQTYKAAFERIISSLRVAP